MWHLQFPYFLFWALFALSLMIKNLRRQWTCKFKTWNTRLIRRQKTLRPRRNRRLSTRWRLFELLLVSLARVSFYERLFFSIRLILCAITRRNRNWMKKSSASSRRVWRGLVLYFINGVKNTILLRDFKLNWLLRDLNWALRRALLGCWFSVK